MYSLGIPVSDPSVGYRSRSTLATRVSCPCLDPGHGCGPLPALNDAHEPSRGAGVGQGVGWLGRVGETLRPVVQVVPTHLM